MDRNEQQKLANRLEEFIAAKKADDDAQVVLAAANSAKHNAEQRLDKEFKALISTAIPARPTGNGSHTVVLRYAGSATYVVTRYGADAPQRDKIERVESIGL